MRELQADVVVVGAGNAAMSAALAAHERGARVVVLERAPEAELGGNSRFTTGGVRFVYRDAEDLRRLMPDLTEEELSQTDFGSYTAEAYHDDLARLTQYRADPELVDVLVKESFDAMCWLQSHGVRFVPMYGRQAYRVDGRYRFWGGLTVEAWGGGPGLVESEHRICRDRGVEVLYDAPALELLGDEGRVEGVVARIEGRRAEVRAGAVVLAAGGFEANIEWRTKYLGPGWDLAKVRGSRFNTGDGIRMALERGAGSAGQWSGCHSVSWDLNAPATGDLQVGDGYQKHSYPLGIMVNARGRRFVDEGADFRNYTYATYGRAVLEQPGQLAWQVFDGQVVPMLRDEYRIREKTKVRADSLRELAQKMEVDVDGFLAEVESFNRAVQTDVPFRPEIKDGRGTPGLAVPKSNWANRLDTPPYEAYGVTCGITFTFGGLAVDPDAHVLASDGVPIPGLYAAGELVGGLFFHNYPGGAGLVAGTVFGRRAGHGAAGGQAAAR